MFYFRDSICTRILLLSLFMLGCERMQYFPDKPIKFEKTLFLAHRGGGYFDSGNTLAGCMFGLEHADGIECDIQISANKTLWLSHSITTASCGSYGNNCFPETFDATIVKIDSCLGDSENYYRLESVFIYMSQYFPNKTISIDVKPWEPCGISDFNLIKEMNKLAQAIIDLTNKYNLENHVLVESESGDFLYYISTQSHGIETYLATNGDFELGASRALNGEFSGISFKYLYDEEITAEKINLLHRKGLKIQLWTLNDTNIIKEAILLNPDIIQTDNIDIIQTDNIEYIAKRLNSK